MSLELGFRYVTQNRGTYTCFLHRYRRAAISALAAGGDNFKDFCSELTSYAGDERNLRISVDHLCREGGRASGPDGVCLQHIAQMERWWLARQLRNRIQAGEYRRGPLKRCSIPKRPWSTELRTIYVANAGDRVVMRAAVQVLQPLLTTKIDPLSFCWTGRGVQQALAYANHLVTTQQRTSWLVEDVCAAFDRVPRQRLRQILERYVPCEEFCLFVLHLVEPPARRGILQGSSLSPMLLDVYLSHLLQQPWRRDPSLPPQLRYVDDILCACRADDDFKAIYDRLAAMLQSAGFQCKHGHEKAAVDLRSDEARWLGYRLKYAHETLEIRSKYFSCDFAETESEGRKLLLDKLVRLHERPDAWRYVDTLIYGLVGHLAPTLPFVDAQRVYAQIQSVAREGGFDEIPTRDEVLWRWQIAHSRWLQRCARVCNAS